MHHLLPIDRERLLQRFLQYVQIATAAQPDATSYPSSTGQLELGRLLVEQLQSMGLNTARQDQHGLVWATVPATVPQAPGILLNAHLDTSPEAPGHDVRPQIVKPYVGGDIALGGAGQFIRASDCPALEQLIGHTLVTTDGRTLLGGDDKAGVAVIMELAQYLSEHPETPHGAVQILFTCDEEIGLGTDKIDMREISALAGYTLDGSGAGNLEAENFSADQLIITALGHNIHPSIAKGTMVNAVRAISQLAARLPLQHLSPESTENRQGFLHPYAISGGVGQAELRILLRDFDSSKLDEYTAVVEAHVAAVKTTISGCDFRIERQRQYRNMADCLQRHPMVTDLAERAFHRLGRTCLRGSIRGGSDGAMLSEKGLPTPNLSVGQHNIHSVHEFVSLDEMAAALEHMITLLDLWQQHGRS